MIKKSTRLRKFNQDQEGMAVIEFAMIAPVLLFLIMGLFDIGYAILMRSTLDGAIQKAAREAALENGATELGNIDGRLTKSINNISKSAKVSIQRVSYFTFSDFSRPEDHTESNGDGICNNNEAFTDENGNGAWDEDVGVEGIGGPKDVVVYTVTVTYPDLFPLSGLVRSLNGNGTKKWNDERVLTARTVLKNQPFGTQIPAGTANLTCTEEAP